MDETVVNGLDVGLEKVFLLASFGYGGSRIVSNSELEKNCDSSNHYISCRPCPPSFLWLVGSIK